MKKYGTRPRWTWFLALAALFFAPALFAADTSTIYAKPLHQVKSVTADFDGDQRLDTALSRTWRNHSQVEIQFGSGINISFESATNGETRLVAMDVDRDNDLDLILFATKSEVPAEVWLNNGHGSFTTPNLWRIEASIPIPKPAKDPENDERPSLANAVGFTETLQTPEARLCETVLATSQAQQTFHASENSGCLSVLLASSRRTRSPPAAHLL